MRLVNLFSYAVLRFRSERWIPCLIVAVALAPSLALAYDQPLKMLATSMADKIAAAGKKNVAVVDFTDLSGNVTELSRFLAEEISVDLTNVA